MYLNFEAHNSDFQPNLLKADNNKNLVVQYSYRQQKI